MHRTVTHYPLTSSHPQAAICCPSQSPLPVSVLAMTFCVQVTVLAVLPLSSLCPPCWQSMKHWEVLDCSEHCSVPSKTSFVINILLSLNPNHTTVTDTGEKVNSVQAKTRTTGWTKSKMQKRWQDSWSCVRNLWNIYKKVNLKLTDFPTWSKQTAVQLECLERRLEWSARNTIKMPT